MRILVASVRRVIEKEKKREGGGNRRRANYFEDSSAKYTPQPNIPLKFETRSSKPLSMILSRTA
jgi:hypothetical protein